jgi:hypothetical protein
MTTHEIKEIIFAELSKVYKLCKYVPSIVQYEQFLETLPIQRRIAIKLKYQDSTTAYNKLFIYRHWYIQQHHKKEIDCIMQMVLLPDVYNHYLKFYKPLVE